MRYTECDIIFRRPDGIKHLTTLYIKTDSSQAVVSNIFFGVNFRKGLWDIEAFERANDLFKIEGIYSLETKGLKQFNLGEDIILKEIVDYKVIKYDDMFCSLVDGMTSEINRRISENIKLLELGEKRGSEKNRRNDELQGNTERANGISSTPESKKGCLSGAGEESE